MQKNDLLKNNETIIRILGLVDDRLLIVNCLKPTMPKWVVIDDLADYDPCVETVLFKDRQMDDVMRINAIERAELEFKVTKKTIRKYLCLYLVYKKIVALESFEREKTNDLSLDQKNISWGLNKLFNT